MNTALLLAASSAMCFGAAVVTSRFGLRVLDARAGAAISIPTATVLLIAVAPFTIDVTAASVQAMLIFAAVGLMFPALVTLLTFQSNHHLGPVVTSSVSSTAPLFALPAAALLLGEEITPNASIASIGIAAGVWVLFSKRTEVAHHAPKWALLLPVSGALLRGLAQALAKAGLLLWPNPFAASLIGYLVSSVGVIAVDRTGRAQEKRWTSTAAGWFILTGMLNGAAVLLMYGALRGAPVSYVAPIIATYPLVTVLLSAVVFRDEGIDRRVLAGSVIVIASVVYLVF
ncbi:MAG: EamA family transporter [Betaproteobacteria bacterium]